MCRKSILLMLMLASFVLPVQSSSAADCGNEVPCRLDKGEYYVLLPKSADSKPLDGAIVFLHGHRGSALKQIRNKGFRKLPDELNIAFVAVQGVDGTWSFPAAPRNLRDEFAFFKDIQSELEARFGVRRERTMLSGFSSGGFMTWYTACQDASMFAGYAPVAGAFWKPEPESCPSSSIPYLFHVHGTADTVVPLAGRPLGGGRWHQGDVFESLAMWRRQAGLDEIVPDKSEGAGLSCERWQNSKGLIELCLHDGGHSVKGTWLKRAWQELAKARGW